jgi:hypothetical protein
VILAEVLLLAFRAFQIPEKLRKKITAVVTKLNAE